MFLLALISTAFAADYHLTTITSPMSSGDIPGFGLSFNNSRDVCVQASTQDCGDLLDQAFKVVTDATEGACPDTYDVACPQLSADSSNVERSFGGCTASLAMKAMSTVDCTIAIEGTDAKTYRFIIDPADAQATSPLGASTGINQKACGEAMLPETCGGVDMTTMYTTYGGTVATCDRTDYPYACTAIDDSATISVGPCGSGSFNWYFETESACTDGKAAADTARTKADELAGGTVSDGCEDQKVPETATGVIGDMDCAKVEENKLCPNAAATRACPVTCNAGCSKTSATGIVGLLFAGLVTLFAF